MDKTIPKGAATLLDFIAAFESRGDYTTIYGNHQATLLEPITQMSVNSVIVAQDIWRRKWGNSAAGRYQMIPVTLKGLVNQLRLTGKELFSPDLQDRMAYELLLQRGYADFMARKLPLTDFALHLAQEWASLPVLVPCRGAHRMLEAGETYYAGDHLNKALVSPAKFEAVLTKAHAAPN